MGVEGGGFIPLYFLLRRKLCMYVCVCECVEWKWSRTKKRELFDKRRRKWRKGVKKNNNFERRKFFCC